MSPSEQLIVAPEMLHEPADVVATAVPASIADGSVSVTMTSREVDGPELLTPMDHPKTSPTKAGLLSAFLAIERSAFATTMTVAVELLSAGAASGVAEVTDVVLESGPGLVENATKPVTVTIFTGPGASDANEHVSVPDAIEHPAVVVTALVTSAGMLSVSTTLVAVDGPPLLRVIV